MQWDASQRQDVPLIGAGGRRTICFCMRSPTWGSSSNREGSQRFFRRLVKSILFWSCFSGAFQCSFSSVVLFVKCSSGLQALNRCEHKYADAFWTYVREKIWLWNSRHLRWLKHCCEMLGGQNGCFHVCSWIGQTTGTVWTRLWWQIFPKLWQDYCMGSKMGKQRVSLILLTADLKVQQSPKDLVLGGF